MTTNRTLIIGSVWPEPRSSAAGSHMLQIIHALLQAGQRIIFASAAAPGATRADLVALGIEEKNITLNCSSFDAWVHALQPDTVIFDRFMTEEQFGWRVAQQCPQALRVLETSDLHCLRAARQKRLGHALAKDENALLPAMTDDALFMAVAQEDIALREIAALLRCDLSLIISRFEMDFLQRTFGVPPAQLFYCPFMVDAPDTTQWQAYGARTDFVTIGNFLHAPNRDAVSWLKQSLWPRIRAQLPQAHLHVYGAYPSQQVCEWHKPRDGFLVHGWTEDALDVMAKARVCLAPLRFGAGLKGKLVDALLAGTPSVTTSIGAEAMHDGLLWPGVVADDVQTFVDAAVQLYRDETVWQRAQQACLPVLQQIFDRREHSATLCSALQDARENLTVRRVRHFAGRMLNHHQHRSTEFMARWIEEKNRNLR